MLAYVEFRLIAAVHIFHYKPRSTSPPFVWPIRRQVASALHPLMFIPTWLTEIIHDLNQQFNHFFCVSLLSGRELMPESIDMLIGQNSIYVPHPTNEVVAQDQAEEKWNGLAIGGNAALPQQRPFGKPTDENREPHPTHSPTAAGQRVGNRMQRPPEQSASQESQNQDKHKAAAHESHGGWLPTWRVIKPSLQIAIRLRAKVSIRSLSI